MIAYHNCLFQLLDNPSDAVFWASQQIQQYLDVVGAGCFLSLVRIYLYLFSGVHALTDFTAGVLELSCGVI